MSPRLIPTLLGVAALALPITASAATTSESDSPINDQGSNYHYRSNITGVAPSVPGLSLEVLEFADRLLLTNHTGKTVTVYGYQGEPYARVLANGTAEQNTRSPATYLNTSFYGNVTVPASANPSAPPHWVVIDRTGQFEWHDHRIHWMSPLTPPQVKDKGRRTLIFDWRVPIRVGAQAGAVNGQLFWTPESSHASTAVIALGVVIALLGLAFVLFVRRRRTRAGVRPVGISSGGAATGPDVATDAAGAPEAPGKEAW
ncbi:MAG TPA: LPXTG cell wall anchor domain-containing protein [Solirubrobacteraceae bacterium]|jgi:LPXTG-motif cell wall-anchored protein|nr:LPXTG cell wall anchor domain-containing protein [Solirubrobacteraceae bacterium]